MSSQLKNSLITTSSNFKTERASSIKHYGKINTHQSVDISSAPLILPKMNAKRALIEGGSSRLQMVIQDKRDKIDKIINSHINAASVGAKISDMLASQIMKGSKTSSYNPSNRMKRQPSNLT